MLNSIINLVKDEASKAVSNAGVPAEKQEETVQTATSTIVKEMAGHFIPDNLSALSGLFGGSGGATSSGIGSNLTSGIESSVVSALVQKVGLNSTIANGVASLLVPAVMGMISKNVKDPNKPGFNVESIIESVTGKGTGGGLLGALGGLFGKK